METIGVLMLFAAFGLGIAAIVLMIRHLYKYSGLPERRQTFWTTILLVFNLYAAPVYYLRYMRHTETVD